VPAIWLPGFEQRAERERSRLRLFLVRKRSSPKHRLPPQLPAFGHACIAAERAPHLRDGQAIVLNPGRTGGALEVLNIIRKHGCNADVTVCEAQTLLYACRSLNPAQTKIFRIKNSVPVAAIPAHRTPDVVKALRIAPGLLRGSFGFQRWPGFDRRLWQNLVQEARPICRQLAADTGETVPRMSAASNTAPPLLVDDCIT